MNDPFPRKTAHTLISEGLRDKLGPIVLYSRPYGDNLFQAEITSDHLPFNGYNGQVETIENPDGTFRFRREEYGYDET